MSTAVELWDTQQKQLIKDQIARDCTDGELKLFAQVCAKNGLDPFTRQIYAIKRGGKMTIQTSIDGFRVVAERSGKYEGQTPKQWCGKDGVWVDVWLKSESPAAARVGVWKTGFREPLYAVATWAEYGQDTPMWKKMGPHMLAKCAESLALRAAFPNDLTGLYTDDEFPVQEVAGSTPAAVGAAAIGTGGQPGREGGSPQAQVPPPNVNASTGEIIETPSVAAPSAPRTVAAPQPKKAAAPADKPTIVEAAQTVKGVDPIGEEAFAAIEARVRNLSPEAQEKFKGQLDAAKLSSFTAKSPKRDAQIVTSLLIAIEKTAGEAA